DTSTGQTLHVFDDPDNHTADAFGTGVAFVGGKIAISATESWSNGTSSKVFFYDATSYAPAGVCNAPTGYTFSSTLAALGSDLLAELQPVSGGKGEIARFTSGGGAATALYSNSQTSGD